LRLLTYRATGGDAIDSRPPNATAPGRSATVAPKRDQLDRRRSQIEPNLPVKPSESDVAAQPFEFLALMRATATPACTLKPCASTHSAAVVFSVL